MFSSHSLNLLFQSLPFLLKSALVTIEISLFALCVGMIGGIGMGILNSQKLRKANLGKILDGFVWIVRGTPLFVQVLIVYYALPKLLGFSLSPFIAGVVALGVNSMAYISEIVRGSINAIPEGQWEAAHILGVKHFDLLKGIILPQMFKISWPSITNELTALIKETSILMVIGLAELTKMSKDIVARELDPMTIYLASAGLYLLMTSAVTVITQMIQKRCTHD